MMGRMSKPWSPSPDILALARVQAGVLSREQCHLAGVSDGVISRLLVQGWWQRVAPGVYCLAHHGWKTDAWAGILMGGSLSLIHI